MSSRIPVYSNAYFSPPKHFTPRVAYLRRIWDLPLLHTIPVPKRALGPFNLPPQAVIGVIHTLSPSFITLVYARMMQPPSCLLSYDLMVSGTNFTSRNNP